MVADPINVDADYGPSSYVQRHRVSWSGVFALPYGLTLGTIVTWASPLPYTITAGRDLNQDLTNNDRPAGVGRNSGGLKPEVSAINLWRDSNGLPAVAAEDLDGADFFNWDLRVSRSFNLGGDVRVEGLVEAFNLTNRVNYLRFVTNSRLATLGQPTLAADPRQVQFGIRITF